MSVDYTQMDYIQVQAFVGVLCGAVIMTSIHNMFVSIIMYKARQTNTSNILKIIFNFGQIVRTGGIFSLYMTPKLATKAQCYALLQFTMVGNVLVRITLSAFLLWRLRQIRNVHNYGMDKWISIILFSARAALTIPYFVFQRAGTLYMPAGDAVICLSVTPTPLPYAVSGVVLEFLIDGFVTFRLVQILIGANKNAAQISTTNIKNKRSLFTAVMYWKFLRLFVSFLYHITTVMDVAQFTPEIPSHAIKHPIAIILSYVITADAEIVRVIEGKDTKKGSSAGTDKSLKSIHSPNSYNNNDLPKYSPHDQTTSTHSEIEDGKIALVSMKRLSFFEWANVVVGKRLRRNNDGDEHEDDEYNNEDNEYNDEDIEEIIDGPSKSSIDNDLEKDLEKDLSQDRRISNLSGTTSVTETSTLDENPDVVIH